MKKKPTRCLLSTLFILVLAMSGVMQSTAATAPASGPSASGHGTILLQDTNGRTVRRQFSDGTVQGNAVIKNPSLIPETVPNSKAPECKSPAIGRVLAVR